MSFEPEPNTGRRVRVFIFDLGLNEVNLRWGVLMPCVSYCTTKKLLTFVSQICLGDIFWLINIQIC
jgi:hypothetical protein